MRKSTNPSVNSACVVTCRVGVLTNGSMEQEVCGDLVAQQYNVKVKEVRSLVWRNFFDIVRKTGTFDLLPGGIREILKDL